MYVVSRSVRDHQRATDRPAARPNTHAFPGTADGIMWRQIHGPTRPRPGQTNTPRRRRNHPLTLTHTIALHRHGNHFLGPRCPEYTARQGTGIYQCKVPGRSCHCPLPQPYVLPGPVDFLQSSFGRRSQIKQKRFDSQHSFWVQKHQRHRLRHASAAIST